MMKIHEYGNPNADVVLLQPIGEHDLVVLENGISFISELGQQDFHWIGFQVEDWNKDLAHGNPRQSLVRMILVMVHGIHWIKS